MEKEHSTMTTDELMKENSHSQGAKPGRALIIVLFVFLCIMLLGTFWYLSRMSPQRNPLQVSKPKVDSVIIGVKSAPLGFYGQESVEYENPTFNFNANIFEGLTTFDKDLKFAKRQLVESWDNPSETVWRLRLRKGVTFHNGDEFTAEDAKYSIEFGKDYVVSDDLAAIKQVRIIDPYTIEIDTNGPSPLLLNNLINTYVLNKKYVEEHGFDTPVGTGPYKYIEKDQDEYRLEANEKYYLGVPAIRHVTYKVIEDNDMRIDALLDGSVDLIEDIPFSRIADIKLRPNLEFKGAPSLRVIYLGMDVASSKLKYSTAVTNPFQKLEVRQALYKAINENEIVSSVMGGHAYIAAQLATPVNFGFNPAVTRVPYDPEGAKKLLRDAGYPDGFDVVLDVPNNRYHNDEAIGKKVVEHLAKVGIRVSLNPMPKDKYFDKVLEPNYDTSFYLLGWSQDNGDAGGAYATLIHTRDAEGGYGGFNIGDYKNSEVDELIEQSDQTVNSVARLKLLQDIAQRVMNEVPVIPLHQQEDSFAVSKKFNWTPRRDNGIRAFEIWPR